MKALGMIEVYGYLAAVEALDSALKAANVTMADVTLVRGGLVAVFITGEVGAVKAATDAAKKAAERIGKVVSVHVIPRPSEQIEGIIPNQPVPTSLLPPPKASKDSPFSPTIAKEPVRITEEQLKKMTVDQLRSLARELGITGMTGKEICFAKKHELIDAISKSIEQER